MNKKSASSACKLLMTILSLLSITISFYTHAGENASHQQIQTLISSMYDKPGLKVETSPIVATEKYAIADWTQGNRGGRALLNLSNGKWTIMACGADGLKNTNYLIEAGIPKATAENLVSRLNTAEKSVNPDRLKLFSLFGTKNDPIQTEHHHHSKH